MEAGLSPPQPAACALGTLWYHMAHGVRALGGLNWRHSSCLGRSKRVNKEQGRDEPGGI